MNEFQLNTAVMVLCVFAHVDFHSIDTEQDGWYDLYSWTQAQHDAYRKWLIQFLIGNAKRHNLRKADIVNAADLFLKQFSWRIE